MARFVWRVREVLRNLRTPVFADGVRHPIRSSPGYDEEVVRIRAGRRERLGETAGEQQESADFERVLKRERKAERIKERIADLESEKAGIKDFLADDGAARLTGLVGRGSALRGEVGYFTPEHAARITGMRAGSFRASTVRRGNRDVVPWHSVLDKLAEEAGYSDGDALKNGIERANKDKKKVSALESEIRALKADLPKKAHARKRRNPEGAMAKRRPTEYAQFVHSFAKAHPSVPKEHLFKSAAAAWHKHRVATNPEVELRPDEVLVLYPSHLRGDVEIEIPAGVAVERIPEDALLRAQNPRRAGAPLRYKAAEETASEKRLRLKREKEWGLKPTTKGVTYKPGPLKRNPTMRCPACKGEVHVPPNVPHGWCPHCGRKVKVKR